MSLSLETIGVPSPFNRETSYFDTSREILGSIALVMESVKETLIDPRGRSLFSSQDTKQRSRINAINANDKI